MLKFVRNYMMDDELNLEDAEQSKKEA